MEHFQVFFYLKVKFLGSFNNREKNLKSLAKQVSNRLAQHYLQKNITNASNNNVQSAPAKK